jgi:hypothetical protein
MIGLLTTMLLLCGSSDSTHSGITGTGALTPVTGTLSATDSMWLERGWQSLAKMRKLTDQGLGVVRQDSIYVIEVGYEHQLWLERDTVEAKAVPRRSGALWYVPLTDGNDVWCDRQRILSKRSR